MSFSTTFGTGAVVTELDGSKHWDFAAGFRAIAESSSSAKLTDILAPLDKRTTIKYALSKIANVYTTLGGDSVPVSERSSNPTGQTLFCELTTILTKANAANNGVIQVPIQTRIELRIPNDADVTDDLIEELLMLTFAGMRTSDGTLRITTEMLRGALVPADI